MESNSLFEIPVFGAVFEGVAKVFEALFAIGADMSPEVRSRSQKVVLGAIIVTQIASQVSSIAVGRRIK